MIGSGAGIGGGGGIGTGACVNPASFGQDYYSPTLPFCAPVSGFTPPQRIRIVGTPTCDGSSFAINLKSPSDIIFHFNPRFHENVVVRNSTNEGNWMHEERYEYNFPFAYGKTFTLEIIAGGGEFIVTIDGQPFTAFSARADPQHITELEVKGDLTLHSVHVGF